MKASQIFLEIARRHAARRMIVPRYCETCKRNTEHVSEIQKEPGKDGEWETLTCKGCGCYHRYRID